MKKPILIVEDDFSNASFIKELLKKSGFLSLEVAVSYEAALIACRKKVPTLILMDINLKSEIDGIEAAKRLKSRFDFALIFVTSYGDEGMINRAEKLKPHGYLVKPVNAETVLATVQTVLWRYLDEQTGLSDSQEDTIALQDDLLYFPHRALLHFGNNRIYLSDQECRLLNILCKNRERIVTNQIIEEHVWPMECVSNFAVASLVYRLRKKIPREDVIRTVVGIGYCLE